MYLYLLILLTELLSMAGTILSKKFQQGLRMDVAHFMLYNFINALFASVYFLVAVGFHFQINKITFLFSVLFALLVFLVLTLNIYSLSRVSVSLTTITATAGSIILSTMFGILYLNESPSLKLILSVFFMLASVILPYYKLSGAKIRRNDILICMGYFLISGLTVIISKLYAINPFVNDSKIFFLMTNLILVFATGIGFVLSTRKYDRKMIRFSRQQVLNIGVRTLIANVGSVVNIILLKHMNISIYTIITSSLSLIACAILSKFYFKEYQPAVIPISVGLAILSIIFNVW